MRQQGIFERRKGHAAKKTMKRIHAAILLGQALSYSLILTFIFANHRFGLTTVLDQGAEVALRSSSAYVPACLVALVGVINLWLTWHYISKSNTVRDMLVVCAWTRRIKSNGQWLTLEEFLTQQLGYAVSHGLSDAKLAELRAEVDRDWRKINVENSLQNAMAGGAAGKGGEEPKPA